MSRVPIRLTLTLAFTGVMAAVLVATGLFLYLSLQGGLDRAISQGLRSRTGDTRALVQQSDTGLRDAARSSAGAGFAQILDRSGRIFDATPGIGRRPLLSTAEIRAAQAGSSSFERASGNTVPGPARLLATPVHAQGRSLVIVVGASLGDRDQALANLGARLLIGGPAALLLAALAGYGLATAALRPVESMRARAAAISPDDLDQRLPLSPSATRKLLGDGDSTGTHGRVDQLQRPLRGTARRRSPNRSELLKRPDWSVRSMSVRIRRFDAALPFRRPWSVHGHRSLAGPRGWVAPRPGRPPNGRLAAPQ